MKRLCLRGAGHGYATKCLELSRDCTSIVNIPRTVRVQAALKVDSLGDSRSIREFVQEAKQELNARFPYSDSEGVPR